MARNFIPLSTDPWSDLAAVVHMCRACPNDPTAR